MDVQVGLVERAYRAQGLLDAIRGLIGKAREAGAAIVDLQHNHASYRPLLKGAPTWPIHPAVAPGVEDVVIETTASDGFVGTACRTRSPGWARGVWSSSACRRSFASTPRAARR